MIQVCRLRQSGAFVLHQSVSHRHLEHLAPAGSPGCRDEQEPSLSAETRSRGSRGGQASVSAPLTYASSSPLRNGLPLEVHLGSAASMEGSRTLSKSWPRSHMGLGGMVPGGRASGTQGSCVSVGEASGQRAAWVCGPSSLFQAWLPPLAPAHPPCPSPWCRSDRWILSLWCGICPRRDSCRQSSQGSPGRGLRRAPEGGGAFLGGGQTG
uniref:Uncharacterized protein n=1 Tax=Molossus molossus TaxID=27622 RepID=A0A7J8GQC4_MOLMO|nr:hypothetical protein HJG59_011271 [Molossus molossus]